MNSDRSTASVTLGLIVIILATIAACLALSVPLIDDREPTPTTTVTVPLVPLPAVDRAMP